MWIIRQQPCEHINYGPLPKALEIPEINSQSSVLQAHIKKNINKRRGDVKAWQSNSCTKTRHFSLCSALNWSMEKAGISYKAWSCQFLRKCFSLTCVKLWKAGKSLLGGQRWQVLCIPFSWMYQSCNYYSDIWKWTYTEVFEYFSHPRNQMYLPLYTN